MRDASGTLWRALNSDAPLLVVLYPEDSVREELLQLIPMLAPAGKTARQSTEVAEAFSALDEVLLLTPTDERGALYSLEGQRDALIARRAPAVLFLLRGGSASQALAETDLASLASWLRGRIVDPEGLEQVDADAERKRFQADTGQLPEEWLLSVSTSCP